MRNKIKTTSVIAALFLLFCIKLDTVAETVEIIENDTKYTEEQAIAETYTKENEFSGENIHGIYVSAHVAGTESMMDDIIDNMDGTSLNAVVIDVKSDEGHIVFDMDSDLVDELGTEEVLVKDMPGLLEKLHEHEIYAIARCVAFRDPFIDEIRPEWMLKTASGQIYEDNKGFNWIDPGNDEAAQYLIEVALGCQRAGFDEVQYDYVRFPTGIGQEDIGITGYERRKLILQFVRKAHANLKKNNLPLSLDVFGTVINSKVDANIVGQEYSWLSMFCEYMSPMIYPSHYFEGTMGHDFPDLYPYDTVDAAMKLSEESYRSVNPLGKRTQAKVRPWLQGFTASYLSKYREYGAEEIKEQIRALNDNNVDSYIIWNPSCKYPWEAFM